MTKITRPNALVRIRAGEQGKSEPISWSYGMVEERSSGKWLPHPAWDNTPGMEPTEFDVVLNSNIIDQILQSHLDCRNTARSFCFRPHYRGDDSKAVALRMDQRGNYVHVECDPRRCPMRIYADAAYAGGEKAAAAREADVRQYAEAYPWAKLAVGKKPVKCLDYTFFTFTLLTPSGEPAHSEGEFAVFVTHSKTTTDRLRTKLRLLYVKTHGRLKGLRLRFVYDPFTQSDSNRETAAWNIVVPEGTDFDRLMLEAHSRTRMIDFDKIDADSTALVLANTEYNIRNWIAHEHPEALAEIEAGIDYLDQEAVDARSINPAEVFLVNQHPVVAALCDRCKLAYSQQVVLPMTFGNDVLGCIKVLVRRAEEKDIFIDDIISASPFAGAFTRRPKLKDTKPEPIEAEVVEIQETDPVDMDARVRGRGSVKSNKEASSKTVTDEQQCASPAGHPDSADQPELDISDDSIDEAVNKLGK
jgi:hypothetical protein